MRRVCLRPNFSSAKDFPVNELLTLSTFDSSTLVKLDNEVILLADALTPFGMAVA